MTKNIQKVMVMQYFVVPDEHGSTFLFRFVTVGKNRLKGIERGWFGEESDMHMIVESTRL